MRRKLRLPQLIFLTLVIKECLTGFGISLLMVNSLNIICCYASIFTVIHMMEVTLDQRSPTFRTSWTTKSIIFYLADH